MAKAEATVEELDQPEAPDPQHAYSNQLGHAGESATVSCR